MLPSFATKPCSKILDIFKIPNSQSGNPLESVGTHSFALPMLVKVHKCV